MFYSSHCRLCVYIATDLKNSLVNIVTNDQHDDWGSIPSKGRCFSVPHHIQAISGAHPVSYALDTTCYLPGGRMSEHKPGQLPQSSGKMKKAWSCFCIIPYILWHCA